MHFVKILQVYTYDLCTFQDVYYLKKKKKEKKTNKFIKKRVCWSQTARVQILDPSLTKFVTGQII